MRTTGSANPTRRLILKGTVGSLAGLAIAGSALFEARAADAPAWPSDAFKQKNEAEALKALYGGRTAETSDKVKLDAPEIAENGAVVPVAVSSTLPERHIDCDPGDGKPIRACRFLQTRYRNRPFGRQPPQDGKNEQPRRCGQVRRQTFQCAQGSQSHRGRLRRVGFAGNAQNHRFKG